MQKIKNGNNNVDTMEFI